MDSARQKHKRLYRTRSSGRKLACLMLMCAMTGCMTVNSLPAVDLSAPDWTMRKGQALWKPGADKPPLAGDLIAARNDNGDVLISFSKPPFPIFTARTAGNLWRIEFVERNRFYSGRGRPPRQFIWFFLPVVLDGGPAPDGWDLSVDADSRLYLNNRITGEEIIVVIDR